MLGVRWKQFLELNKEVYSKGDVARILQKLEEVLILTQAILTEE